MQKYLKVHACTLPQEGGGMELPLVYIRVYNQIQACNSGCHGISYTELDSERPSDASKDHGQGL